MYGLVAFGAFEVPRGLLEDMGIGCGGTLLLRLQDGGNSAGSGGLFANGFAWSKIWFWGWRCELFTVFLEPGLYDGCSQALVYPCVACVALIPTAVGFPLVLALLPWLLALVKEVLLALLGFVPRCPRRFAAHVMVLVFKDPDQSVGCLLVDFVMVVIQNVLPSFLVSCGYVLLVPMQL